MSDSKLSLRLCNEPDLWDNFVKDSPQGSIFCQTKFLEALGVNYDLWFVEEKGQLLAGAVVLRDRNEVLRAPYPYTVYQCVLFSGKSASMQSHRRTKWILEVFDALLNSLSERYNRLSFCMHYSHEDLRGLQWFHYHEPHLGQFRFELRYTGLIDLRSHLDFESYLETIRPTRRNLYKQAIRQDLIVENSRDIDTFEQLYRMTFARQGVFHEEELNLLVRSITTTAIQEGFGDLLICRNRDGQAISATLFLFDEKCGYYMFGANHPEHNKANGGTLLLLENIRCCQSRSLEFVDVMGINSPNRGDFKTSFNAVPVPYFVVTWERP